MAELTSAVLESSDHEKMTKQVGTKIQKEMDQLSPMLPFKFGSGLFLQYISNRPGIDDKIGILDAGLYIGLISMALVFLADICKYMKQYISRTKDPANKKMWMVDVPLDYADRLIFSLQMFLLTGLFVFCISHYSAVSFIDTSSMYYVKEQIYFYSLAISISMFSSHMNGIFIFIYLAVRKPSYQPNMEFIQRVTDKMSLTTQMMPIGIANCLMTLYILKSPDDQVFLVTLALIQGGVTVFLISLESIGKIAMLIALRDGHLNANASLTFTILKVFEYIVLSWQFLMFCIMFGHCIVIKTKKWRVPQNSFTVSVSVSVIFIAVTLFGGILFAIIKCIEKKYKSDSTSQDS